MCQRHLRNRVAANAIRGDIDDADPRMLAYLTSLRALERIKPRTMAGVVALARTARQDHDDVLAANALDGLLRIYGDAA